MPLRKGLSIAGGTRLAVLLALLAVAALAVALTLLAWPERSADAGAAARAPEQPHEHANVAHEDFGARVELGGPGSAAAIDVYPADLFGAQRFEGHGRLRVFAFAKHGAAFPERWSLTLEPSKVLIGGEHTVARRVDLEHGEREVALDDVALGGYELRALAHGLCSQPQQLMLAKPDEVDVVLHVEFYPAGYLTGRVVDATGKPVDGLTVVLESQPAREIREALTDPAGVYLFEQVMDGEYRLLAASATNPLAPAKELAFMAPSLHMADIQVPALGEVLIQVLDERGQPVVGASITGYGTFGGRAPLETDSDGRARARHLPAGAVTFIVTTAEGRQGREKLVLGSDLRAEITLRLRP